MRRSYSLAVILCAGLVGSLSVFTMGLQAASTLEMVVSECQKRTGFGTSTCTTLIKKYMNVERCKEYTGFSDAECTEKIKEIREATNASGDTGAVPSPVSGGAKVSVPSELPPIVPRSDKSLTGLRAKKEQDLIALWKRTEAITGVLRDRGVDTRQIEASFPEFERRAESLLGAYDTYRLVYDRTSEDSAKTRASIRDDARQKVIRAKDDLVEYYQVNILQPLRVAQAKVL